MLNINRLRKDELLDRLSFRCVHRHNGISHDKCYDENRRKTELIGHLDIEASNLDADFGIVLCYCIKEDGGKTIERRITPEELKDGTLDRNVVKQCVEDMRKFDRLTFHYGDRFNIPFLRTRAIFHGLDFPLYKEIKGTDTCSILWKKFKLHSNRLESACNFFGIPTKAHPIKQDIWITALGGNKKSLDYILTHCREDVSSLEALYHKISDHNITLNKSI